RQCVDAESVWPVKGLGWAYGGAPLNATTPGENVGAFYPSTNKLLFNLLEMITTPGPLLYTVDTEKMIDHWRKSFERFWEFATSEWLRHRGYGWRGLISRLATLMTAFDEDGVPQLGGRDPDMPLTLINSPRDGSFAVPFSASLYERIIKPFCVDLQRTQLYHLDTLEVAYIPPGAGGVYVGTKIRDNDLGNRFVLARRALLNDSKRMLVDLRRVTDPEYRDALMQAGVKISPVNPKITGPGVTGTVLAPDIKPPRAPSRPKVAPRSPLAGAVRLARAAPRASLGNASNRTSQRRAIALGAAVGGTALTAAVAVAVDRRARSRKT
ncbi:MAG: hypothetical protein KC431_04325, partial [Myxococcales bacterium]|nr:hypothetical protein [Myxococcales bacterium]